MKRIILFLFSILCLFSFSGTVFGANLYECEYSGSNIKAKLTISANESMTAKVIINNYNGKDAHLATAKLKNWDTTIKSSKFYVGTLGCPKYLAVAATKCTTKACDTIGGFSFDVWANWNSEKATKHCSDANKRENTTCVKIGRVSDPGTKVTTCYYDKNGNRTMDRKNSVLMAFDNGSKAIVEVTTPDGAVSGAGYGFEKDPKDFYKSSKMECLDKIYVCKGLIRGDILRYYSFSQEKYLKDFSLCQEMVNDIEKDAQEANAERKGMSIDDWIEETKGPTAEECKQNPDKKGCAKNRCEVISTDGEVFKILKQIIGYVQIGSVFAVLIFCVLDLGGAIASSDDDAFRKARGKVMKRIIALVLIFLVPLLINFIINLVNLGACSEEDYDFIGNLFN